MTNYDELYTPERILLGPGPSMVPPRVLVAMSRPLIGHLDPKFIELMKEVQDLLRYVFQTSNPMTLPIAGTGSAGMECAIANILEPGDNILVGVNGYFGERICEMASRYGAIVTCLDKRWGEVCSPDEIDLALQRTPSKVVAIVHAETSTGALTPLEEMAKIIHKHGALFLVDCVTSLGGIPIKIDDWDIDIAYSGTQKCLSCPPGLSPITVGKRALDRIHHRKTKVTSWYLDLTLLEHYWGDERTYHHTAPISMNYALREALCLVQEEGLDQRFLRHRTNSELLWGNLEDLGLTMLVSKEIRLPSLTTVAVPTGVDEAGIRKQLLNDYNIEIAGGLGEYKGNAWRIGLMGYSSCQKNVSLFTNALSQLLKQKGGWADITSSR